MHFKYTPITLPMFSGRSALCQCAAFSPNSDVLPAVTEIRALRQLKNQDLATLLDGIRQYILF